MSHNTDGEAKPQRFTYDDDCIDLTWDNIDERCDDLWQIGPDKTSSNKPEDLRNTYANIYKRIVVDGESPTDEDRKFSWTKDVEVKDTHKLHSVVKYGVPMHVTGDPRTANLFVCLLNPSFGKGFDKYDPIEKVIDKDDLFISDDPKAFSYRIYHKSDNIFRMYWKTFTAADGNSVSSPGKALRERAIGSFYYYLAQYFSQIVGGYGKDIPESLRYFSNPNTVPKTYTDKYREEHLKPNASPEEHKAFINTGDGQNFERLLRAPICNLELYPFRAVDPGKVAKTKIERVRQLSIAILVRRVLDFIEEEAEPPIIAFRSWQRWFRGNNRQKAPVDAFFENAEVWIDGKRIKCAADFIRAVEEREGGDKVFFRFSSNRSAALSKNNLVRLTTKEGDAAGEFGELKNNNELKLTREEHQALFAPLLKVDLEKEE